MDASEKTVAIAFDLNFRHAAEIFSGVSDYITEARLDWQLMPLNFGFEVRLMELAESGRLAGAIGTFVSAGWVAGLTELGVPAVNMFNFSAIHSIPNVGPDDKATGRAAAAHLIAQRAKRFAFVGADGVYYTRLREAGFRNGLPDATDLIELRPGNLLAEQIRALPRDNGPIGMFCSNDHCARELILEAQRQGLQCGRDILVVGVDNDPSESIFAGIGISSFQQPIRETGYKSAQALHTLLTQGRLSADLTLQTPAKLIPRASSLPKGRARIAQQAANLLHDHLADTELNIESVAKILGISRRVLELALREQLGTSPYQFLCTARLDLAKRLLKTTKLRIMEVGSRCGYPEPHHFSAWFKQRTSQSPKAFREQQTKHTAAGAR
jgi:DNA-binding LacI/PurR family transcriptional regulator